MDKTTTPGFTGAYSDSIVAGYPLGNGYRWYVPGLMRFNAPDELSPFDAGGPNPYAYCVDDPINHSDPTGHFRWSALRDWVADIGEPRVEANEAPHSGESIAAERAARETHVATRNSAPTHKVARRVPTEVKSSSSNRDAIYGNLKGKISSLRDEMGAELDRQLRMDGSRLSHAPGLFDLINTYLFNREELPELRQRRARVKEYRAKFDDIKLGMSVIKEYKILNVYSSEARDLLMTNFEETKNLYKMFK